MEPRRRRNMFDFRQPVGVSEDDGVGALIDTPDQPCGDNPPRHFGIEMIAKPRRHDITRSITRISAGLEQARRQARYGIKKCSSVECRKPVGGLHRIADLRGSLAQPAGEELIHRLRPVARAIVRKHVDASNVLRLDALRRRAARIGDEHDVRNAAVSRQVNASGDVDGGARP